MTTLHHDSDQTKATPAPQPHLPGEQVTLWDLFQMLQDLTPDEEAVLLAVDDLLARGLVRWAEAPPPVATLH